MAKRRRSYYDNYWPRYEPTRPIDVEDGIKAKSKRGKFVKNWWADRWIAALQAADGFRAAEPGAQLRPAGTGASRSTSSRARSRRGCRARAARPTRSSIQLAAA